MILRALVAELAIDPRKLTAYALDPDNPKGAAKALMFERHLGYTKDNYQLLLKQIQERAPDAEAIFQFKDEHGERYRIDLEINGVEPHQREIVRTGWLVAPNSNIARLITLYVRKRDD